MYVFLVLVALVALVPLLCILNWQVKYYRRNKLVNRIPGPSTRPLVGNAHQMGSTPVEILKNLFLWWNKYGKNKFRIWIGLTPFIVVTDIEDIEHVSKRLLGTIKKNLRLLTSSGNTECFKDHGHYIESDFQIEILQNFHETMNEHSRKFVENLREASAGGTIFDFQEMVHLLTLDVICEIVLGLPINAMRYKDSALVAAFKDMCYNINMRAFHSIYNNNTLYKISPDYNNCMKTLKTFKDFTYNVIEKRRRALSAGANIVTANADSKFSRLKSLVDTLLPVSIAGYRLTNQIIFEEVSTFMFEGHNTTTSAISFAVYLLSRHPDIQEKVFAEQQRILGYKAADLQRDATFSEIGKMEYLDLFIKESQRLYPSVPFIGLQVTEDWNLNDTLIPEGASLYLFLMAMGYNEKNFEDPYRCRPERFDMELSTTKCKDIEYMLRFNAGPQNSIGQKFALLELKTVVSKIVRTFEILPPWDGLVSNDGYVEHNIGLPAEKVNRLRQRQTKLKKYDPVLSAVLTLKSENGIQIRLRPRQ